METILIFAGGESPTGFLTEELPVADLVVAADSGYDTAVAAGFDVGLLVGDFDSIQARSVPDTVTVDRHSADKDASDLELALERVMDHRPERVVVVGGAGGRFDHELITATMLCSTRWQEIEEIDWVTHRGWSHVVRGRRMVHGDVGDLISLVPMGGTARGVTTRGLRWSLDGDTLHPGTTRGLSNRFSGPVADITVAEGCLLVVLPID
ncbi:MAG TPA: thiamine diphosphokinase [Acidimicrobiia bacterium]|jgi:thiamine pyrophosphokinase|nr:thiamine diphosphokinase [Acidimicrobiia bacterium]